MKFTLVAAAAASLFTAASARIYDISVPSTLSPGQTFDAVLLTENYIQSVYDVAVAFGISAGKGYPEALGNVLGSGYLGPDHSNTLDNITFSLTLPTSTPKGLSLFSASLMSLYGASSGPVLEFFNATVNVV